MSTFTPASTKLTPYEQLLDDLAAEQAALDAVLGRMTDAQWDLASHAPGWLVRDQIAHLAHFDEAAALAMADPDAFRKNAVAARASVDRGTYETRYLSRGRAMRPPELRAWWHEAGEKLLAAASPIDPKARLPWYGPEMGAATFVTARLMETWSHGLDVVDVVDIRGPTRTACGMSCSSECGRGSSRTAPAASPRIRHRSMSSSRRRRGPRGPMETRRPTIASRAARAISAAS